MVKSFFKKEKSNGIKKGFQPIKDKEKLAQGKKSVIFLSYATKNTGFFKIHEFVNLLAKFDRISSVLFWEEDMKDNIIYNDIGFFSSIRSYHIDIILVNKIK